MQLTRRERIRRRMQPVLDLFKRGRVVIHAGDLAALRQVVRDGRQAARGMNQLQAILADVSRRTRVATQAALDQEARRLQRQAIGIDEQQFRDALVTSPYSEAELHRIAIENFARGDIRDAEAYLRGGFRPLGVVTGEVDLGHLGTIAPGALVSFDPGDPAGDRTGFQRRELADVHARDGGMLNRDAARRTVSCAICGHVWDECELVAARSLEAIGIVKRWVTIEDVRDDAGRVSGCSIGYRVGPAPASAEAFEAMVAAAIGDHGEPGESSTALAPPSRTLPFYRPT